MPMCDAYIPKDALAPEAEREMLKRISELLIKHEVRGAQDLIDDDDIEASHKRARQIAWISVIRHEAWVASAPAEAPYYKFVVHVPEAAADQEFRDAVNRDVTQAVADAEGGKWPHPEFRVWIFTWEVPEGTWGATGQTTRFGDIMAYLAPELREPGEERLAARRRDEARALLEAAGVESVASS
jgi:phenylpyruvate tautomerase PptA (4-oxalocrotonate tautomerase family)